MTQNFQFAGDAAVLGEKSSFFGFPVQLTVVLSLILSYI